MRIPLTSKQKKFLYKLDEYLCTLLSNASPYTPYQINYTRGIIQQCVLDEHYDSIADREILNHIRGMYIESLNGNN